MSEGRKQMKHKKTQNHHREWTPTQNTDQENSLLEIIKENSQLPEEDQTRFQQLTHMCKNGTMSNDDLTEYQTLLRQLEVRNLKRIEALMALAQIKGKRYR